MSLGVSTTTPEGIVLAADSRQSYRNSKGMSRIGSDSASKVFKLNNRIGLIVTGLAFLPEDGILKNVSKFIDEFKDGLRGKRFEVRETAERLSNFFKAKYNYKDKLKLLPNQIRADLQRQGYEVVTIKPEKDHIQFSFKDSHGLLRKGIAGVDQLQFMVAGFNNDKSHEVLVVNVPGVIQEKRNSVKRGREYGADWIGQIDVISRIVLGFDGRIGNLPMMQKIFSEIGEEEANRQLLGLEYVIQWGTMTLQDGIDFSELAITTTTSIQRFSDGIAADPGDIAGVGGPVDIAILTEEKGFVWINKKSLAVGDVEVDMEKMIGMKNKLQKKRH